MRVILRCRGGGVNGVNATSRHAATTAPPVGDVYSNAIITVTSPASASDSPISDISSS